MGLFDGVFGNMFDLNHDGKTSLAEELMGLDMMGFFDDIREEPQSSSLDDDDEDEEEYEEEEEF